MEAAQFKNIALVRSLLRLKVDVNLAGPSGTALHYACMTNLNKVVINRLL